MPTEKVASKFITVARGDEHATTRVIVVDPKRGASRDAEIKFILDDHPRSYGHLAKPKTQAAGSYRLWGIVPRKIDGQNDSLNILKETTAKALWDVARNVEEGNRTTVYLDTTELVGIGPVNDIFKGLVQVITGLLGGTSESAERMASIVIAGPYVMGSYSNILNGLPETLGFTIDNRVNQWRVAVGSELAQRMMRPRKVTWQKYERETMYLELNPETFEAIGVRDSHAQISDKNIALDVDLNLIRGASLQFSIHAKPMGDTPFTSKLRELIGGFVRSGPIMPELTAKPIDELENQLFVEELMRELSWSSLNKRAMRIRTGRIVYWFGVTPQKRLARWLSEKKDPKYSSQQYGERIKEIVGGGGPKPVIHIGEGGKFIGGEMLTLDGGTYEYGLTTGTKVNVAFERMGSGHYGEFIPIGYSAAGFKGDIPKEFLSWFEMPRFCKARKRMLTSHQLMEMVAEGDVSAKLRVRRLASYLTGNEKASVKVLALHEDAVSDEVAVGDEVQTMVASYLGVENLPQVLKGRDLMMRDLKGMARGDSFTIQQIVAMAYVEMLMREALGDAVVEKIINEYDPPTRPTGTGGGSGIDASLREGVEAVHNNELNPVPVSATHALKRQAQPILPVQRLRIAAKK